MTENNTSLNNKPVVCMYYTYPDKVGGPLTYIHTIEESYLSDKYSFINVFQNKAPGGIDLGLLFKIIRQMKSINPDLVHVHGAQSEGFYGVMAAKLAGCRTILTIHGFAFDDSGCKGLKKILYKYIIEPISIRLSNQVYCVCEYASLRPIVVKNAKKHNRGYIHNPASVLNSSISSLEIRNTLNVQQEDVLFCYSGRVSKEKGFGIIEEIIHNLSRNKKFKILILGDGSYTDTFVEHVQEEIKNGSVILTGRVNNVADYLAASDVFLFPSFHENLSIALLEAGVAGLPAVVSAVGGNPEVIDNGVNGFVISSMDYREYMEKCEILIEDGELRKKMGKEFQRIISEKFSPSVIMPKIDGEYIYAINNKHKA